MAGVIFSIQYVNIIIVLIIYAYANSPELATGADECPSTAMGSSIRSCPPNCATRSSSSGVSVRSLAYACMQTQNMANCSLTVLWHTLDAHWRCFGASSSHTFLIFATNLSLNENFLVQTCHSRKTFCHKPVTDWQCFGRDLSLIDSALAKICHSLTMLCTGLSLIDKPVTHWQDFGPNLSGLWQNSVPR